MANDIFGNTSGIKKHFLAELQQLYQIKNDTFVAEQVLNILCFISREYNREISIGINKKGFAEFVSVGNVASAQLSIEGNDIRVVHTHPSGNAQLSDMDIAALKGGGYYAMASVGVLQNGAAGQAQVAHIAPEGLQIFDVQNLSELSAKLAQASKDYDFEQGDRAILVAINDIDELKELTALAKSAGAEVLGIITQNRQKADTAYLVGKGKLLEIAQQIQLTGANCLIFDNELSGIQIRNLSQALGVKIVDRSMLILDIFAARAQSMEGKLQVELAQLKYNLPRLIGSGGRMAKYNAGIGMRGPGEKKLELDRRRINRRVFELEQKLQKLKDERKLRAQKRQKNNSKTVSLVGYTNAGKSTLMNLLAKSEVLAEDKLFATLDPITRKVFVDSNKSYLLTDTVGFINKLPHEFIDAFSSTLDEARDADLLLHIVDLSDPDHSLHIEVVHGVLEKMGISHANVLLVYNKGDKVQIDKDMQQRLSDGIVISAKTKQGLDELCNQINNYLFA